MTTFKDLMDRFEPLTEEQQKDLLFMMLDGMDFYAEKMEKAKTEEEERNFDEHFSDYQHLATFLVKDHYSKYGPSGKSFILTNAHNFRLEWEKNRKEEPDNL